MFSPLGGRGKPGFVLDQVDCGDPIERLFGDGRAGGSVDIEEFVLRGKQDEKSTSIRMRKCRRMRDEGRA